MIHTSGMNFPRESRYGLIEVGASLRTDVRRLADGLAEPSRAVARATKIFEKKTKNLKKMKSTRLIDLVKNYLEAEDLFCASPTEARGREVLRLKERLRRELAWLDSRRAEEISRMNP